MARPLEQDGAGYRRQSTSFWWVRYLDRSGIPLHAIPAKQRLAFEGLEQLLNGHKRTQFAGVCKIRISKRLICGQIDGGREGDRTPDPLLAKQVHDTCSPVFLFV